MSSSIKLKNANGKTVSVTNSNANQTDKEVIYLNTVYELANASGSINAVAIVSDLIRGGTFEWSATGTANGGTVFAGVSGYWHRQYDGAVNVKWFGALSVEESSMFDSTNAFRNAFLFKDVYIPNGTYNVITDGSNISAEELNSVLYTKVNAKIIGIEATIRITDTGLPSVNNPHRGLWLKDGSSISGVNFTVANTTATYTDTTLLTIVTSDSNATFNYLNYVNAVYCGNDTSISDCTFTQFYSGITASQVKNVKVNNCTIKQSGEWCTQFYDCDNITFSDNTVLYGGGSGGVAFSSSKYSFISNNYIKVSGTGINPGGSNALGFNVENITVTGNVVIARDCIVMENGALGCTITGNTLLVNTEISNGGSGISNTSDSSGTYAGAVGQLTISGNTVLSYGGNAYSYAFGIKIGSSATDINENMALFTITGNTIRNAVVGIYGVSRTIGYPLLDVLISDNNLVIDGQFGIHLENSKDCMINNNKITSNTSTVFSNYIGIYCDDAEDASFSGNIITGYGYGFKLTSSVLTTAYLNSNKIRNGRFSGVASGDVTTDGMSTTNYFYDGSVFASNITTSPKIEGKSIYWYPSSPITVTSLATGTARVGDIVTIQTNGNVTFDGTNIYLKVRDAITTTPGNDDTITFLCFYATTTEARFLEIARTY